VLLASVLVSMLLSAADYSGPADGLVADNWPRVDL